MAKKKSQSLQNKLPKDLFDVLLKDGDFGTLLSEGGSDLTQSQLRQLRGAIGETSETKIQKMAKSLEGTEGYQNFMSFPIVKRTLGSNKKQQTPQQTAQPATAPQTKSKKKDPSIAKVTPKAIVALKVNDSEADILAKMLNLYQKDYDEEKKLRQSYQSKRKEIQDEREKDFKELINAFQGNGGKDEAKKKSKGIGSKFLKYALVGGAGFFLAQKAFAGQIQETTKGFSSSIKDVIKSIRKSFDESPNDVPGDTIKVIDIPKNVRDDKEFMDDVKSWSKEMNINPADLMAVMAVETGGTFSPSIKNPNSSATGLIQFTEATAKSLGTTTKDLANMSRLEQFQYVKKYFDTNKLKHGSTGGEIYGKVFLPARSDRDVLTSSGENFYEMNKGLDIGNKGYIASSDLSKKADTAKKRYNLPKLFEEPPMPKSEQSAELPTLMKKYKPRRSPVVIVNNTNNYVAGDTQILNNTVQESDKSSMIDQQYYRK